MEANMDMILSKDKAYNDLINYGSIKKQLSRIIPVYYMDYQNYACTFKRNNFTNLEEYEKLKEEIISLKESISILKSQKQQKLKKIEQLRCQMRKIGNKQIINDGGNELSLQRFKTDPQIPMEIENGNDRNKDNDVEEDYKY